MLLTVKLTKYRQSARDYSNCALNGALTGCFGSATTPEGTFFLDGFLNPATGDVEDLPDGFGNDAFRVEG